MASGGALLLAACGGSGGEVDGSSSTTTTPPAPPSSASDVGTTYETLGRACGEAGHVVRSLKNEAAFSTNNLWRAPEDDPGVFASPKRSQGWSSLMSIWQVGFEGVSENLSTRTPEQTARCDSAREILTPITDKNGRAHYLNFLLFAGDHAHATAFPAEGLPPAVDAPVRLRGYLDAASGVRETGTGGVVMYRDAQHQYIPVYVKCDAPLKVTYEALRVEGDVYRAAGIDPQTCRAIEDEDAYSCLYERLQPLTTSCTFVAVDAKYTTVDGKEQRLSIGGRVEPKDGAYRVTVDRFAFHQ